MVSVSTVAPAILITELEFRRAQNRLERPPILAPPGAMMNCLSPPIIPLLAPLGALCIPTVSSSRSQHSHLSRAEKLP